MFSKLRKCPPGIWLAAALALGVFIWLYMARPVPLWAVAAKRTSGEPSPTLLIIQRTAGSATDVYEIRDVEAVQETAELFRGITVRYEDKTDIVPTDPVLWDVTFVALEQAVYTTVGVADNGFAYADRARYAIQAEDEDAIIAHLDTLCAQAVKP